MNQVLTIVFFLLFFFTAGFVLRFLVMEIVYMVKNIAMKKPEITDHANTCESQNQSPVNLKKERYKRIKGAIKENNRYITIINNAFLLFLVNIGCIFLIIYLVIIDQINVPIILEITPIQRALISFGCIVLYSLYWVFVFIITYKIKKIKI